MSVVKKPSFASRNSPVGILRASGQVKGYILRTFPERIPTIVSANPGVYIDCTPVMSDLLLNTETRLCLTEDARCTDYKRPSPDCRVFYTILANQ